MARTVRFHLDENCSNAIARGLRLRGIEVTTSPESGLIAASDEEQLAYASREGRIIVTQDKHFLRFKGVQHAGIAYSKKGARSVGEIIDILVLLWEIYEPEQMVDRIEYL